MPLSVGIAGLPNVGKSTLLNALSHAHAEASNYPFCTIEQNVGVAIVPDPNLKKLEEILSPRELEDLRFGARERVTDVRLSHIRELPQVLPGIFAEAAARAERVGFAFTRAAATEKPLEKGIRRER